MSYKILRKEKAMSNQKSNETFLAYWLGYVTEGNTLAQTPSSVDTVALAFAWPIKGGATGNTISTELITRKYSKDDIIKQTQALHAQGIKVVMSIGNNPAGVWEISDPITLAQNAKRIIVDEWGLDGIDLDNEVGPDPAPDGNFVQFIKALRNDIGSDKTISLPVYLGTSRDAYLSFVKDEIDYVFTMAYWDGYDAQISLLQAYQGLVGNDKAGIGVAEAANPGQNTPFKIVPKLAQYTPKAGMMLWTLNSTDAAKWCQAIGDNLPD